VHRHLVALLGGEVALPHLEDFLDHAPIWLLGGMGGTSSKQQQGCMQGGRVRACKLGTGPQCSK
jgi:hypothetical protein